MINIISILGKKSVLSSRHSVWLFLSIFFINSFLPSAKAVVLDWSGSYELELNTLQNGNFEQWGSSELFHNLHLKPDIKAFDGVHVRSWFHLAPRNTPQALFAPQLKSSQSNESQKVYRAFYLQKGIGFGGQGKTFPPLISVRDLYLEVVHDFGLFQIGWKPHHFALGMYYNDSTKPFSSFYNKEGSTGFISWRGFIGSSYYVQPMVHYIDEALVNLFIQAGFKGDKYGAEIIYKTSSLGITPEDYAPDQTNSYFGLYGYYKVKNLLGIQLEAGTMSEVYGGVVTVDWQTPVKWLNVGLDVGASTSDENTAFYFDPSFSSNLSFLLEEYEVLKSAKGGELKQYLGYSFHSAFYVSPSADFSILDSLNLQFLFSIHLSYSDMEVLLYYPELTLQYQLAEGVTWNTGLGVLFPKENNWHIGFISQAAITF